MGSAQTLASKNSQENVTSNNARSVDDCSSNGLSLQRKAIAMQGNSNVMQRMAWVATKPLDALSKDNELTEEEHVDMSNVRNSEFKGNKRKKLDYNSFNLKLHHRHFVFSPIFNEPGRELDPDEQFVQQSIRSLRSPYHSVATKGTPTDNNIGYESENGKTRGPGALFSDDFLHRNYTIQEQISYSPAQDKALLTAMRRNTPHANGKYKTYNLILSNCQDWVEDVRDDAGL